MIFYIGIEGGSSARSVGGTALSVKTTKERTSCALPGQAPGARKQYAIILNYHIYILRISILL